MPNSQPTAFQQTVCKFHLDPQYHIFHWGSTILGDSKLCLQWNIKFCASFQIHWCNETGVTVWKCSIRVKISDFFCPVRLWNLMMTLKNIRAPLLYYAKLSVSFQSHWWIQTWVTVLKHSIWVKIGDFFVPCDLEILRMALKNNRAPLLCCF